MGLIEDLARAQVYDLEQPRFTGMPIHPAHYPGYFYGLYRRHKDNYRPDVDGPRSGSSGILTMMEHSGTHIDALCHQACDLLLHGDVPVADVERSDGFTALGVETVPPLLGRGVLLDIAAHKGVDRIPPGYSIPAEEMEACAAAANVVVKPGDVLLVRTGYGACWNDEDLYLQCGGVSKEGSLWAEARGVRAVGADNLTWDNLRDRDPESNATLFAHVHLLRERGIYLLENLYLETLAAARSYVFAFVGIPLKLKGATGSPIRPLALVG
jgi:kynurenine formamidase